jgi:hypothetical protein
MSSVTSRDHRLISALSQRILPATAKEGFVARTLIDAVEDSALNPSILVDFTVSPFSLKRRSNPSAAFAEMVDGFSAALRKDDELASAFASFQEHFKGVVLTQEDAVRLAALDARGADKLGIEVGEWPSTTGPGLAFMYDAALETLRSSDLPIEPGLISARAIRMFERSLDTALPLLGSMTVTAVELALDDDRFRDRLRASGSELGVAYKDQWQGPCEDCIFEEKDAQGNVVRVTCGTKQQCETFGLILLIILILLLLKALWDWL